MSPERVIGWVVAAILIILLVWVVVQVVDDNGEIDYIGVSTMYEEIGG